jgi:hypothetical protein
VNNRTILNIGARTNDNPIDVAPQHGAVPNAGFFLEDHIADYRSARNDPRGGMDGGAFF